MDLAAADKLVVVLVRARNPSNIGAVARAMHDFGFRHLRVVNEFPVPFAAAKSAVDAASVLAAAQESPTLGEAVADCSLVLGTTAVGERVLQHPLYLLPEGARRMAAGLNAGKVALVFGSEKTGLSNEELSHCHALLTIPMHQPDPGSHLSMNLGQAAAVCLWQLAQELGAGQRTAQAEPAGASAGELERLTSMLAEVMQRSGYTRRHPANAREPVIRRLVRRMGLVPGDAAVWSGVLRQILHVTGPTAINESQPEASEEQASSDV